MGMRHPLITLGGVAIVAWVGVGLFGKFVPPQGIVAPVLLLLLLFIALVASFVPLAQVVGVRAVRAKWYRQESLRHALRQSMLLAGAIVANLALLLLRAWFWGDMVLILLAVLLVELIALARK